MTTSSHPFHKFLKTVRDVKVRNAVSTLTVCFILRDLIHNIFSVS